MKRPATNGKNNSCAPLWQRLQSSAAREFKKHPRRLGVRIATCFFLLFMVMYQQLAFGRVDGWLVVGLAVCLALTLNRVLRGAFDKGEQVHDWALEEHETLTIQGLTGKNPEECETLLQYHMKRGNIKEADRISQKLLNLVEGAPFTEDDQAQAKSKPAAKPGTGGAGLPSWMHSGKEDEQKSTEQGAEIELPKSKLPDWMK